MKQEKRNNKHKNNRLLRIVDEVRMETVHEEEYFKWIEGESVLRDRFTTSYSVPFRGGEYPRVGVSTRQNHSVLERSEALPATSESDIYHKL